MSAREAGTLSIPERKRLANLLDKRTIAEDERAEHEADKALAERQLREHDAAAKAVQAAAPEYEAALTYAISTMRAALDGFESCTGAKARYEAAKRIALALDVAPEKIPHVATFAGRYQSDVEIRSLVGQWREFTTTGINL